MGGCMSVQEQWFEAAVVGNLTDMWKYIEKCKRSQDNAVGRTGRMEEFTALMYAAFYGHTGVIKQLAEEEYDVYNEVQQMIPILSDGTIHIGFETRTGYSAFEMSMFSGTFAIASILLPYYLEPEEIQRFYCFSPPHDFLSLLIINNTEDALEFFEKHFDSIRTIIMRLFSRDHLTLTELVGNVAFADVIIELACSKRCSDISKHIETYCCQDGCPKSLVLPKSMYASHLEEDEVRIKFISFETGDKPLTIPKYMGESTILLRISVTDFLNEELSDSTQHSTSRRTHRTRSSSIGCRRHSHAIIISPLIDCPYVEQLEDAAASTPADFLNETSNDATPVVAPSQLCMVESLMSDSLSD